MRNFIQTGGSLGLEAPYAVKSGDGVLIGSLFGIAAHSAAAGGDFTMLTTGVFEMPKVPADAAAMGQKIYWKAADRICTTEATGNTLIGAAVAEAFAGFNSCYVRLNGVTS